ncbi:polysaccharide pyruvyl transferase family protein [Sulfitobacter pontiacus]|uniref:polysaccharide pyruvyl transferase family protein n=1 Tax=Sulfitobacter pontiacus TaxID=60137 RepID=UPI0030EF1ECC
MKTVNILTFIRASNYGAMLQAYALSRTLSELNFTAQFIDVGLDAPTSLDYLKRPGSLLIKLFYRFSSLRMSQLRTRDTSHYQENNVFEEFRRTFLNRSDSVSSLATFEQDYGEPYAYIVGSDQVWAIDPIFYNANYLLDFAGLNAKKIAYAPSFGKDKLEIYQRATFVKHLKRFDALSIRESSSLPEMKRLGFSSVQKVLDPTLLLQNYDEIMDDSVLPDRPYLLVYTLSASEVLTEQTEEMVRALEKRLNMAAVFITADTIDEFSKANGQIHPTVGQFVSLFANADFVLTNSFHGTVFSAIFRRNFIAIPRDELTGGQNLRMIDLLHDFGISDRYLSVCDPDAALDLYLLSSIDYQTFADNHSQMRQTSVDFLKQALA